MILAFKQTRLPLFLTAAAVVFQSSAMAGPAAEVPAYRNRKLGVEVRVADLLRRLTQAEKFSLLALDSNSNPKLLNLPPIDRLGIPSLRTTDAPEGIRDGPATNFPMGIVMTSTWNPGLIGEVGSAIADEAKIRDREVLYGPTVNMLRSPQDGRYFENFSEDPFLTSKIAVAYVEGVQHEGVAASVKHFICNDQEFDRHRINVLVDERALHEIYLPPFKACVQQGHVWSLMDAFNKVNGTFMSEDKPLETGLLKDTWNWDGLLISDWGAIHDTVAAANAGTDVEMPSPSYFAPAALTLVLSAGQVTQAQIDDKVRRVLRLMVRTHMLDGPEHAPASIPVIPAHAALALKVAQEGIVLLKNEGCVLPLDRNKIRTIAVIGPNAASTQLGGRLSANVPAFYTVDVAEGINSMCGPHVHVSFAQGCPRFAPSTPEELAEAVELAKRSDVAVVVVGTDSTFEGEELDAANLSLPGDQNKLIQAIAEVNKRTIVVLNSGTPEDMSPWIAHVPGVLEAWYSGQETGTAVADILFGYTNPSGKLTGTQAMNREDYADWGNYPGSNDTLNYAEGIYLGYRHFDKDHIAPRFPFGFGLSYTTFAYSKLSVRKQIATGSPVSVRFAVENTGKRAGDEIVQVYVKPIAPAVDRPLRELKGFQRVSVPAGKSVAVHITLAPDSFAYWDVATHAWKTDPGVYAIDVGASSRDIRQSALVHLVK